VIDMSHRPRQKTKAKRKKKKNKNGIITSTGKIMLGFDCKWGFRLASGRFRLLIV
jgi:hypothetical protein